MASPAHQNESRVGLITSCYIVPIPLMLIATSLRVYTNARKKQLALDDYLIILATVFSVSECTSGLVYGPPYGFGRHIDTISAYDLKVFMLGDYVFSHLYNVSLGTIKLAILAFYYRVFCIRWFQRVVICTSVFVFLWICTIEIVLGLQCRPVAAFWDSEVTGTCFNLVAFSYFTNISNLVTDIWIFLLPLPLILRLQISITQKVGLCCVFLIGLLTCVISAVRLSVVVSQGSPDFTWDGVPLGAMSVFEPLGGIFCANLPIIYHLWARTMRKIRSSRASGSKPSSKASSKPQTSGLRRHLDSEGRPDKHWIRLPTATSFNGGNPNTTVCKVEASKTEDIDETEDVPMNSISVKQDLRREIERN